MGGFRLHHVAIIVTDLERSAAFYRDLLGLTPIARPPFSIPGLWLGVDGLAVHLTVHPAGSFRRRAVDSDDSHVAFNTDDFDAALARAEAMGFRQNAAPDAPFHVLVRRQGMAGFPQLYLIDPDRNIIEINGAP